MNKIIPYLRTAEALPNCNLFVQFEDGVKGVIDLNSWRDKGLFAYWNEAENFKNFIITADRKLEWNNEIDMDPDSFYLKLTGKNFEEYAGDKQFLRHSH